MKRFCYAALSGSALALLTSCAAPVTQQQGLSQSAVAIEADKQREMALKAKIADEIRLSKLAQPILQKNVDLCEDNTRFDLAVVTYSKAGQPEEFDQVASTMGYENLPKVTFVIPGSPTMNAGMKVGDVLMSIDGRTIPQDETAPKFIRDVLVEKKTADMLTVEVKQNGDHKTIAIPNRQTCNYTFQVIDSPIINATADGEHMNFTRGMMRFAQSDQELQVVIGHEMAHNLMEHIDKKRMNAVPGLLLDILAAGVGVNTGGAFTEATMNSYSQDFESEADYVGIYLLARSNIETSGAANFWRRMATEHPDAIAGSHAASHPSSPERFLALENTITEVKAKKRSGGDLKPNLKPKEHYEQPANTNQGPVFRNTRR